MQYGQSISRRTFLCALAGMGASAFTSRRAGAGLLVEASVSIDYGDPGRAIPEGFIGLSYNAVLASPEYLSQGNLSMQGLGPSSVLRLGGNSSERTIWRDTGNATGAESFVITPAAINKLAALLKALDWRLIYGLTLRGHARSSRGRSGLCRASRRPRRRLSDR